MSTRKPGYKHLRRTRVARISLLLLSLFLSYQVSITVFGHVHMVGSSMLVHSHPYKTTQHTHTDGQLHTLANLAHLVGVSPQQPSFRAELYATSVTRSSFRETGVLLAVRTEGNHLRAPPAVRSFLLS